MTKNYKNEARKVGFEIEFQNLTPEQTADIIKKCINGKIQRETDASYIIKSDYGDFKAETDAALLKKLAETSKENVAVKKFDFEGVVKDILQPLTKELVPTEIVSPPLDEPAFKIIKNIEKEIIKAGAKGSNESAYFAFAMQFNPEIIKKDSLYILSILRSYILLSSWLRSQIEIGLTRDITGYVDDFEKEYALLVLKSDYSPSMSELIDDYLEYNPTRNRGLDFLPLFLFLDEKRVRKKVKDKRVKSRPTFHYRLPSCQLGLDSWNIFVEWKRWCLLEQLASDKEFIQKASKSYIELCKNNIISSNSKWLQIVNHYVEDFRW